MSQSATRVLGREVQRVSETIKDGDKERSPRMAVLPTGALSGRVMVAGVLTNIENKGDEDEPYWQASITTRDGVSVRAYVGQYQDDAVRQRVSSLQDVVPEYVVVVGKIRTYESDNNVYASIKSVEGFQQVGEEVVDGITAEAVKSAVSRIESDGGGEELADEIYDEDERVTVAEIRQGVQSVYSSLNFNNGTSDVGSNAPEDDTEDGVEPEEETEAGGTNDDGEETEDGVITEELLDEELSWSELQGAAAAVDDEEISGNSTKEEILGFFAGMDIDEFPIPVALK